MRRPAQPSNVNWSAMWWASSPHARGRRTATDPSGRTPIWRGCLVPPRRAAGAFVRWHGRQVGASRDRGANPAVRKRSLRVTCLPCRCRGVSKVAVPSRSDSLPVRDPRMRDRRWNERQSSRAPGVSMWRLSWLGAGRPCCGSTGPGAVVRLGRRSRSRRRCRRAGRTGKPGARVPSPSAGRA
jgi:hypothetical protein